MNIQRCISVNVIYFKYLAYTYRCYSIVSLILGMDIHSFLCRVLQTIQIDKEKLTKEMNELETVTTKYTRQHKKLIAAINKLEGQYNNGTPIRLSCTELVMILFTRQLWKFFHKPDTDLKCIL